MVLEFPQNFLVISPPKLMQELPIDFYSSGAFWVLPHFFKCYYLHLLSYVRAKNKKVSLTNNDHCLHKLSAITRDLSQRKITPLHQVFRGSCPTASHLCQFLFIFPSSKMDTARLQGQCSRSNWVMIEWVCFCLNWRTSRYKICSCKPFGPWYKACYIKMESVTFSHLKKNA